MIFIQLIFTVSEDGHSLIIDAVEEAHLHGVYTCLVGTALGFATAKYQLQFKGGFLLEIRYLTNYKIRIVKYSCNDVCYNL